MGKENTGKENKYYNDPFTYLYQSITDTIRACQSLNTVTMYVHITGNTFKPLMDH